MKQIELPYPGLELDRLVAEKVMGLKVVEDPVNYRGVCVGEAGPHGTDLPHYSTKIKDAFEAAMKARLFTSCRALSEYRAHSDMIWRWAVIQHFQPVDKDVIIAIGSTPAEAICLALLSIDPNELGPVGG